MPYQSPYPEFEFSELIQEAMSILSISWNEAIDVVGAFRVDAPEWCVRYYDFGLDEITEDNYDEETVTVMKKIFEKHNTTTIRVLK